MPPDGQAGFQFDHAFLARLFVAALLIIGLGTWAMGYEPSEVSLIPCLITELSGHDCPGCGMTRSSLSLVQGRLSDAWHFNPIAFILIPIAFAYAIWPRQIDRWWRQLSPRSRNLGLALALIAVMIRWLIVSGVVS